MRQRARKLAIRTRNVDKIRHAKVLARAAEELGLSVKKKATNRKALQ